MKKHLFVSLTVMSLALCHHATAQIITQWTFESNPTGTTTGTTFSPLPPEFGSGSAVGVHESSATSWTFPVGNGSALSWNANNWAVDDYYEFQVSTLGYSKIGVSFDHTSSGTGPRDFNFSYSTDGDSYSVFDSYSVLANSSPNNWMSSLYKPIHTFSYDLSAITAIDEAAAVYFRLTMTTTTSAAGGTVGTGGTSRVDNFTVFVIPEPSTFALGGFGLLALLLARRRR